MSEVRNPTILDEVIAHADLSDMPDVGGTVTDHDARYYTETEVDAEFAKYLLIDGTRAMTGALNLDDNDIQNIRGLGIGKTPDANTQIDITGTLTPKIVLNASDASDPTFTFKTTNTAHQLDVFLDESATGDALYYKGQTASVNTSVSYAAKDNQSLSLFLFSGGNYGLLSYSATDTLTLRNNTQDADAVFGINDGGVAKTITWDADVDKILHSAGLFDFGDNVQISTINTDDPTLSFKTTNTAHEIDAYLDESATDDELFFAGQTASVNTTLNVVAQDGELAGLKLWSGGSVTYIYKDASDHLNIDTTQSDVDLLINFNDGGSIKTITLDASENYLDFPSGHQIRCQKYYTDASHGGAMIWDSFSDAGSALVSIVNSGAGDVKLEVEQHIEATGGYIKAGTNLESVADTIVGDDLFVSTKGMTIPGANQYVFNVVGSLTTGLYFTANQAQWRGGGNAYHWWQVLGTGVGDFEMGDLTNKVTFDASLGKFEVQSGRYVRDIVIAGNGDTTPSVANGEIFSIPGAVTITDFDDDIAGQIIHIIAAANNVVITDGTNIFLNGSANWTMNATDTLTLVSISNNWYELSRSDN